MIPKIANFGNRKYKINHILNPSPEPRLSRRSIAKAEATSPKILALYRRNCEHYEDDSEINRLIYKNQGVNLQKSTC